MKRYIILAATIKNIGGAENYLQSKLRWLREQGWNADIIYYNDGPVMLPYFKDCHYCMKDIKYPTYYYNSIRREIIRDKLLSIICDNIYKKIVIESTVVDLSTWGELVASILEAKHFIFSLQETDIISNHSLADYLKFKYERCELAGIGKDSVKRLMESFSVFISIEKSFRLSAHTEDVLVDYEHPLLKEIQKIPHDYAIGSIGRLEKPYVLPTIMSVLDYIKIDINHQYLLLLIGDAAKGSDNRNKIEELCNVIPNLKLFITGYIYPVPIKLVQLCDVFISSSGSAGVSARCGIPTVSIDCNDLMPIGILGYTTKSRLNRTSEPIRPVYEYLEEILKQNKYPKTQFRPKSMPDYTSHMKFIEDSCKEQNYYDISRLCWNKEQRLQRLLMPVLGPKWYHKLISSWKKK